MITLAPPTELNGHPVMASARRKGYSDRLAVLIKRTGNEHQPYVVATWSETCGIEWVYGHYYSDFLEAVGHFAWMTGQSDSLKREAVA